MSLSVLVLIKDYLKYQTFAVCCGNDLCCFNTMFSSTVNIELRFEFVLAVDRLTRFD